jgi:hypothetical protein
MPDRSRRRPTDANQLGKLIVALSVGEETETLPAREKNPAAVALGRLGGQKGGKARAESLSAHRRKQIAKAAALARYGKKS